MVKNNKQKFYYISDVHLEFTEYNTEVFLDSAPLDAGDAILLIAGDFLVYKTFRDLQFLEDLAKQYKRVVVIAGNHEYYYNGESLVETDLKLQSMYEDAGIVFLQSWTETVEGFNIYGGTMWTPLAESMNISLIKRYMNDFNLIKDFTVDLWTNEYNVFLSNLKDMQDTDIVMSHHIPLDRCIGREYKDSATNDAYCSNIVDEVSRLPKVWVYGHTHDGVNVEHGDCEFLTNAHGYFGHEHSRTGYKFESFELERRVDDE